jgi:hypothetical protein
MKKFASFIAIGTFFSTVEEFLTVVVLKRDVPSYVFTLIILFPVFLTVVFFSSKALDRLSPTLPMQERAHFLTYGFVGLMLEWFLMGMQPWGNPHANPVLMLLFQLGMFSFWATVGFAPRLFLSPLARATKIRKHILWFFVPYIVATYVIGLSVPGRGRSDFNPAEGTARFVTIIVMIIVGYSSLNFFYRHYFRLADRLHAEGASTGQLSAISVPARCAGP